MLTSRTWKFRAAISVLALVGAACGSGADSTTTSATLDASASPSTSAAVTDSPEQDPDDFALQQEALQRVDEYFVAANAGDVDAMPDILGEPLSESRRRSFEFHADFKASGVRWVPGECEAGSVIGSFVTVECPMQNTNPVFVATGASSLIAPFQLRGEVLRESQWISLGVRFDAPEGPLRSMVEYMEAFYPEGYLLCDPDAQTGEFSAHGGIARVPECSAVLAPLLTDIAAWVEAGRPADWVG
jgi:hypothetical protein